MRVTLFDDEAIEALNVIISHIAANAALSDRDRAMLKRWRASKMRLGSDDMNDFVNKVNEDLERNRQLREKSQIRKPDWIE